MPQQHIWHVPYDFIKLSKTVQMYGFKIKQLSIEKVKEIRTNLTNPLWSTSLFAYVSYLKFFSWFWYMNNTYKHI